MQFRVKIILPTCVCLILIYAIFFRQLKLSAVTYEVIHPTEGTSKPPPEGIHLVTRDTFTLPGKTGIPLRYVPPPAANVSTVGRAFDVEPSLLASMGMPFEEFVPINMDNIGDFVLVTAASSNHYKESIDGIAGVQRYFPNYKLYYYDIGLKKEEVTELKTYCNVFYRKFDFSKYPPHVKTLTTYAFKPLIVQEMLREFESVFWMDASIRPVRNFKSIYPRIVKSNGYVQVQNTGFYNYAVTNQAMYEYIPTSIQRQKSTYQGEANCLFFRRTESVYWGILHWWVLCALDRNCMAPVGSKLGCIIDKSGDKSVYMNCHRFDQSALGLLASNLFGYDHHYYLGIEYVLKILRKKTAMYKIQICPRD